MKGLSVASARMLESMNLSATKARPIEKRCNTTFRVVAARCCSQCEPIPLALTR